MGVVGRHCGRWWVHGRSDGRNKGGGREGARELGEGSAHPGWYLAVACDRGWSQWGLTGWQVATALA